MRAAILTKIDRGYVIYGSLCNVLLNERGGMCNSLCINTKGYILSFLSSVDLGPALGEMSSDGAEADSGSASTPSMGNGF